MATNLGNFNLKKKITENTFGSYIIEISCIDQLINKYTYTFLVSWIYIFNGVSSRRTNLLKI